MDLELNVTDVRHRASLALHLLINDLCPSANCLLSVEYRRLNVLLLLLVSDDVVSYDFNYSTREDTTRLLSLLER